MYAVAALKSSSGVIRKVSFQRYYVTHFFILTVITTPTPYRPMYASPKEREREREREQRFYYRAMLCIRGTSHDAHEPVSVCLPSVRLSQVGVPLKRLNIASHKQHHTIAQGI